MTKTYDKHSGEYICKYTTKKGYKTNFPRVGAFEVYFKHKTIFSKLKTSFWPHPDMLAGKIKLVIKNMNAGKNWMEGINHKDMSESEPEEDAHELPNPTSIFGRKFSSSLTSKPYSMPRVPKKQKQKKKINNKSSKEQNLFITNPITYNMSESSEDEHNKYKTTVTIVRREACKSVEKKNDSDYDEDYENEFEDQDNAHK